jgi:hypothetical protein
VLWFNASHNLEHYGNLMVYMRLKEIVPPSKRTKAAVESCATFLFGGFTPVTSDLLPHGHQLVRAILP